MNSYLLPKKCYIISRSYSFFIIAVLLFFMAATANAYDSDYSNEVCVAGGIACAADTGSARDSGGGGRCLISAAADGSRLAAEMPAVLLMLGFFFMGIGILRERIRFKGKFATDPHGHTQTFFFGSVR